MTPEERKERREQRTERLRRHKTARRIRNLGGSLTILSYQLETLAHKLGIIGDGFKGAGQAELDLLSADLSARLGPAWEPKANPKPERRRARSATRRKP